MQPVVTSRQGKKKKCEPCNPTTPHSAVAAARQHCLSSRVCEGAARDVVGVPQKAADERLRGGGVPNLNTQFQSRYRTVNTQFHLLMVSNNVVSNGGGCALCFVAVVVVADTVACVSGVWLLFCVASKTYRDTLYYYEK